MAEQDLPGLLIMGIGGTHGVQESLAALLKKHFSVITMKELLENKKEVGKKIQCIFVSEFRPTIDQELLESLPNLKVIGNSGVGVDHLNLKMISNFGVRVTNTPHAVADSTADMGMALMLASARRLVEGSQIAVSPDTNYFAADWLGVEVTRATLGIIGMGRIGYKVAQRARAFEMKILYHNRNRRSQEEEQAVGACYSEMEDLLQQSDFVMLVVNLTPQTEKLIGKKELGLMKPTATLINISRGAVIDQDALVEALQNKTIKAAALDVTYPEPLPRSQEEEQAVGACYSEMEDLLQQSDFVMLVVNLAPQTEKLIGKKELGLMKPTATLINISRGAVIDQDALVEALQNKTIKAAALDVTYPEPLPRSQEEEQAVGACYSEMEDLLQQSDFVMLVVNLAPQTEKLIGKKELGLMKPTATLINISRGAVIDQDALVEALQNKTIKAAALDVTYPEPLPRNHPLLKLNNVIITPHIGTATVQATHMMAEEAIANMLSVLNCQPIPSEVFPQ
ncbi:glyoxylate/hydroxypyruvate reductase B isoform X3 [Gallus gallus]|nr:glyoxylate/hydroxypyruvate reductase B isoform X3 [Gallus gallus]XP_040519130.1 glyoxylate/hydroxypyruvate reductase B isoform X3 [Gallus gallus]XP_046768558.1 glyoxylate/hydroxypyruvate reductase B isoform X3 [Gallus gallus]XP_046768559.1 glyoxylate/hydroxypyruvate reductase B isoform X3 [Gallus gallus]XP_046794067.1 glyoxylate/hydroxypyruvate reductase B isoform X3 [Gallus gallus]XP_046794068.1 glyoxylate/hydroxypyruvate reductase B isoform X3 [Gallus gallus]